MNKLMNDPNRIYAQLIAAFNQREWSAAQNLATQMLAIVPRHPETHYIAGISALELQQIPRALEMLRKATIVRPDNAEYAVQLAKALTIGRRNRDAAVAADQALALAPRDPRQLDMLGVVYSQIGIYDSAVSTFRLASEAAPRHAAYRYNLATALVAAGDLATAEVELERCISLDPRYWRAHLTLSQLRRQTPESNHVERLVELIAQVQSDPPDTAGLVCMNMAMAKEYEDLADYPRAFDHLVKGKRAGGANRDYSIGKDAELFAIISESFPAPAAAADGYATDEPIFIIGMPRTGTTLVERIVSSHPDVHSAGELLNFGMVLKNLSGSRTLALVDRDTIERSRDMNWHQLGESYLSSTRPTTGQKPRFIDKLPHNFMYAGFIANALPNARIICLRRNPMDTCLSNFRQLFAPKSPYFDYSFDLMDIGHYYLLFDRLMAHWKQVLPGRIMEIDYETLVDSQEAKSRELLDFCDLPWDEVCMNFERNPAPVATASAVQVRAPIYRNALERWRKYEPQLSDLHDLLSKAGVMPAS
ncbi:MAG: sulfotransferase [Rhodanobacter sp.]